MKNIAILIAILFSAMLLSAQDSKPASGKTSAEIAQMRSEHLKMKLNLSEEQTAKIYKVLLDEEKEKEIDRKNRKAKSETNQENIKKVLTPEQLKEFERLMENRSNQRQQHRSGRRAFNRTPADKNSIEK